MTTSDTNSIMVILKKPLSRKEKTQITVKFKNSLIPYQFIRQKILNVRDIESEAKILWRSRPRADTVYSACIESINIFVIFNHQGFILDEALDETYISCHALEQALIKYHDKLDNYVMSHLRERPKIIELLTTPPISL